MMFTEMRIRFQSARNHNPWRKQFDELYSPREWHREDLLKKDMLITWQRGRLEGGHPEHLGDGVPREEDERGAVDGGVGGHAERVLDLGVDVGEGDDDAGVVHLDDAAHAGVDGLQDGHLGARRAGERAEPQVKDLEPPVLAHHLGPLEHRRGLLAGAVPAAGDDEVGLAPRRGAEPLQQRRQRPHLAERVRVEERVHLLRVHGRPLRDVAGGERAPPLLVAHLHDVLEDDGRLGDVGESVLAVPPRLLVVRVHGEHEGSRAHVLLQLVA
jgi:hypothetical protein